MAVAWPAVHQSCVCVCVCVQADAAVLHATRGLQEDIAGQEDQIQRLKHAAANSQPAVQQVSQAYRLLHAISIERSADGYSIAALSREVKCLLDHKHPSLAVGKL